MVDAETLVFDLRRAINSHLEWLLVRESGRTFPLTRNEIDVRLDRGRALLAVFDDSGFGVSRVASFEAGASELSLEIEPPFRSTHEIIRLVPRTSARELSLGVELARLIRANQIAAALVRELPDLKLTRVAVSVDNGRVAQVFARDMSGREIALMADVTATMIPEAVLTSAVIFSERLRMRRKPINIMAIAAEKRQAKAIRKLIGLFGDHAAARFRLFELGGGSDEVSLKELKRLRPSSLWREKPRKITLPAHAKPSGTAQRILDLAPRETDLIFSKQGETIRFLGLPFARVRTVAADERAWFGIDRYRRMLTDDTWPALVELVDELKTNRNPSPPNMRHEFYRMSPEAWLESILRRDIRQLDANLILSPIYNQFRTSADKIDLLAIRRDRRLVIIELKTSPDRETVFQAADYWRKIELQRRRGELRRIRAFGDMEILDKPALVYVAAPALSFHRDFGLFAQMLRKEIEVWRFELREDWRSEVKVLMRRNYEG